MQLRAIINQIRDLPHLSINILLAAKRRPRNGWRTLALLLSVLVAFHLLLYWIPLLLPSNAELERTRRNAPSAHVSSATTTSPSAGNQSIYYSESNASFHHIPGSGQLSLNQLGLSLNQSKKIGVLSSCVASELVGRVQVQQRNASQLPWTTVERRHSADMLQGGHFLPRNCTAKQRVAIIIPYRDRERHLKLFLNHMLPILKRQLIEFQIFVVEQEGTKEKFNKGALFNAGYEEALHNRTWDCFILHDVDLLLEDDRNIYHCDRKHPRHFSVSIDKLKYNLPYRMLVGGVLAVPTKTFRDLNGFSNMYWGWGAEDDDFSSRIVYHPNYKITRQNATIARYAALNHAHTAHQESSERLQLLNRTRAAWRHDGLSSLHYHVVLHTLRPLFTHIEVRIGNSPDDVRQHMLKYKGNLKTKLPTIGRGAWRHDKPKRWKVAKAA